MTAQPLAAQPIEVVQPAQPAPTQVHQAHVTHQPQMVYVHKPWNESMFSQKTVAIMVIIGVILTFLGAILATTAAVTEKVSIDNRQDKQVSAYTQYKYGVTILVVGLMLQSLFMLGAAIAGPEIAANVKVGLLVFSAIALVVTMMIVISYPSPMLGTGPTIID